MNVPKQNFEFDKIRRPASCTICGKRDYVETVMGRKTTTHYVCAPCAWNLIYGDASTKQITDDSQK